MSTSTRPTWPAISWLIILLVASLLSRWGALGEYAYTITPPTLPPAGTVPEMVVQGGHSSLITSLAFSPDGQTLASGGDDHRVILWDMATGVLRERFEEHTNRIVGLCFSTDGARVASASLDRPVHLWDARTGQVRRTFVGSGQTRGVALVPGGRAALSVGGEGKVVVWDTGTGRVIRAFGLHAFSVALAPDGKTVATGGSDGTLTLWSLATGRRRCSAKGPARLVSTVAFSPDGASLASSDWSGNVSVWESASLKPRRTLRGAARSPLAFRPDGRALAYMGPDRSVILTDPMTSRELSRLHADADNVEALAFSRDGRTLATGGWKEDPAVLLWDAATGRCKRVLRRRADPVSVLAFSPDGRSIAAAAWWRHSAMLWDARTGEGRRLPEGGGDGVAFSPDGALLATADCASGRVLLWNAANGSRQREIRGMPSPRSVAFSPEGTLLAVGCGTDGNGQAGRVILLDVGRGQIVRSLEERAAGGVRRVIFSPDGRTVASCASEKCIRVWDVGSGRELATFTSTVRPEAIAFSPDGRLLAQGTWGGVALRESATGRVLSHAPAHRAMVFDVAFSSDGRTLASAGGATVALWDVLPGGLRHRLTLPTGSCRAVAFSPDGRLLAAGGDDGALGVWETASGSPRALLSSLDGGKVWLARTRQGYYDCSIGGDAAFVWRIGGGLFPFDQ